MDPKEKEARNRLKKLKQIEKQIGLNKMTPTQRKSLRQLKRIYPVNPGSKFVMKKDEDMKPSIENKKNLTSTSVRKPTKRLKQVNINPPRANTSSATSVRKPTKRLKQPKINNKSKEKIKKSTDDNKSFVRELRSKIREDQLAKIPKPPVKNKKVSSKKNEVSSTEKRRRQKMADIVPSMRRKKAKLTEKREQKLASSFPLGTGETIERKKDTRKSPGHPSIRAKAPVAAKKDTRKSPGHPSIRAKAPVAVKKVKPVVKTKVKPVVKTKVKPTQSEKILKAQPKLKVKPSKTPTDKDQEEINKNVKADPKITAKSLPAYLNNPIFKKEIKERGGREKFEPDTMSGKMSRFGRIGDDSTNKIMAETVYRTLDKNDNKTAAEKKLQSELYSVVMKRKGGMVKRNMGGPAKPRKKTVFRRGGGKALRGFGKATYSNKMY